MSSLTDALFTNLQCDLSHHLDQYQLDAMSAGTSLWPDATLKQAQSYTLGLALLKKFNDKERPSAVACQAALDKFLQVNDVSREFVPVCQDRRDEELLGGVKSAIEEFWYHGGYSLFNSFSELISRGGVGSGANLSARGNDFYTKLFDSPLSTTKGDLLYTWEKTVSSDPRWAHTLKRRAQRHSSRIVAGNKLSFVNKNVTVARCISTEPTINMWYQLGVGRILTDRLAGLWGIDIKRNRHDKAIQQDTNRELAREGSLSGKFSTIDLESASDTLSMGLMREILPEPLMQWCELLRSPTTTLPDGRVVTLGMMSTMGNGFTFPLQTIVFTAVVTAAYRFLGIKPLYHGPSGSRNLGVYGDDIIVLTEAVPTVFRLLKLIGCIVNQSKTYIEGPFRESCGGDYFNGHHCRGVYVKKLHSPQDFFVTINGLNRWSALTGIRLSHTVQFLERVFKSRKWRIKYVPADENDDAGVHVPLTMARGVVHLQHGIVGYSYSAAVGSYLEVRRRSIVCGQAEVPRSYNPHGLWLCFLLGSVVGHRKNDGPWGYRIGLRQRHVRYTTRRKVTPMWDTLPPHHLTLGLGWRRWSNAVESNLLDCLHE